MVDDFRFELPASSTHEREVDAKTLGFLGFFWSQKKAVSFNITRACDIPFCWLVHDGILIDDHVKNPYITGEYLESPI